MDTRNLQTVIIRRREFRGGDVFFEFRLNDAGVQSREGLRTAVPIHSQALHVYALWGILVVGEDISGGWGYQWWVGILVVGGDISGGWAYQWWVGILVEGGDISGGWGYQWWVGILVVGGGISGGWGYQWWVGILVVGGDISGGLGYQWWVGSSLHYSLTTSEW